VRMALTRGLPFAAVDVSATADSGTILAMTRERVSQRGTSLALSAADQSRRSAQHGILTAGTTRQGNRQGPAVALPRGLETGQRFSLPFSWAALGPFFAWLAFGALIAATAAIAVYAAAQPSILVPRSTAAFPGWLAGPLHGLFGSLPHSRGALEFGLSAVLVGMTIAYVIALLAVRTVSMRALWIVVGVLMALLLVTPPLQLTDLFNYLGYARLGGLHGLNPYTHVIGEIRRDPIYLFSTWHGLHSPYGELFTALTYPLAFLSLPVATWIFKVAAVLASVGILWLVAVCARRLGRDPRLAVAFVGLNPVFLVYAIGGFHVDLFMLLASTAAVALFLSRRDRTAGALMMVAFGIKVTGLLLLPFMLVAARKGRRRLHLVMGAVLAAVPLAALSISLFGLTFSNVFDQSHILTQLSIPNLLGLAVGAGGGTQAVLRGMEVLVVAVAVYQLVRMAMQPDRDWLAGAGWVTLALVASAPWLMPWYVIWLLPLAALARRTSLRAVAVALTLFLVLTLGPDTTYVFNRNNINLLQTPAGRASMTLEHKLVSGPK